MDVEHATETIARLSPLRAGGGRHRYDDAEIASWVYGLARDRRPRRPGAPERGGCPIHGDSACAPTTRRLPRRHLPG